MNCNIKVAFQLLMCYIKVVGAILRVLHRHKTYIVLTETPIVYLARNKIGGRLFYTKKEIYMSELATVIESFMDVVRVNKYIGFDYNMPWGGGTEIIKLFSRVEIVTKYNKVIVGFITGFEESNVEGKQDYITVKTEKGIVEVGIYDIESLECEEDALVV